MPSFNIHLAVAVRYSEKNNIENKEAFFRGSIDPDLVKDKAISHYTGMRDKNYLRQYVFEKVRLNEFLKENKVETDYEKGVFLHLATDFIFYQEFLKFHNIYIYMPSCFYQLKQKHDLILVQQM